MQCGKNNCLKLVLFFSEKLCVRKKKQSCISISRMLNDTQRDDSTNKILFMQVGPSSTYKKTYIIDISKYMGSI